MAQDIENKISMLQDQVLKYLDEEENLGELKRAAAKDFRERIAEIKKKRTEAQKNLKVAHQAAVEEQGTMVIEGSAKLVAKGKSATV